MALDGAKGATTSRPEKTPASSTPNNQQADGVDAKLLGALGAATLSLLFSANIVLSARAHDEAMSRKRDEALALSAVASAEARAVVEVAPVVAASHGLSSGDCARLVSGLSATHLELERPAVAEDVD